MPNPLALYTLRLTSQCFTASAPLAGEVEVVNAISGRVRVSLNEDGQFELMVQEIGEDLEAFFRLRFDLVFVEGEQDIVRNDEPCVLSAGNASYG